MQLVDLTLDHTHPQLFGGLLRFLGQSESSATLAAWAISNSVAAQLSRLADALAIDFPRIPIPDDSRQVHVEFHGQMTKNYLAAQFAARRPPGLTEAELQKIARLRVWILVKAVEFRRAGTRADENLRLICRQLRRAIDGAGDPKLLRRLIDNTVADDDWAGFQLSLETRTAPRADKELRAALSAVLQDRRTPVKDVLIQAHGWDLAGLEEVAIATVAPQPELPHDPDDRSFVLPPAGNEDEVTVFEVAVFKDATPAEAVSSSRAIALQSQQSQQYLCLAWDRARPDELAALKAEIDKAIRSDDPRSRLLAGITAIAVTCRRSMQTVETIGIAPVVNASDDWQIDLGTGLLHRKPPRRRGGWKPDDTSKTWVNEPLDALTLGVREDILETLRAHSRSLPGIAQIGQIWASAYATERLASAFDAWCKSIPGACRLSSGLLVRIAEQSVFELEHDQTYARLLTSPSRAGIPGSGAYPSWPYWQVAEALAKASSSLAHVGAPAVSNDADQGEANALGSELDPVDEKLASTIAHAHQRLAKLAAQTDCWLQHHNALTGYLVAALLASTGARPVRSPFESIADFDLVRWRLFIEDKESDQIATGGSGRVVPLTKLICELISGHYLSYLDALAKFLGEHAPCLAAEIHKLAARQESDMLPLFFFLNSTEDGLEWREVSEAGLDALALFDWPLPWNLFRHRLASRLRRNRFDPELIDAQLGHSEAGSETFGDYSPRCWEKEEPSWRNALEEACLQLPFQAPPSFVFGPRLPPKAEAVSAMLGPAQFGRKARKTMRGKTHANAAAKAATEIDAFIGSRPPESLSADDWEALARKMLLTENNLRQPNASIRYRVFEARMLSLGKVHGEKPRLRLMHQFSPPSRSSFSQLCVSAADGLARARGLLHALIDSRPISKTPKSEAAILAALDLCLNGRLAISNVLQDISCGEFTRLRLVILGDASYVEWIAGDPENPDAPSKRWSLPERSAYLLDRALRMGRKPEAGLELSPEIRGVFAAAHIQCSGLKDLHRAWTLLGRQIDAQNLLALPAVMAGDLSGRVDSYALGHADWIRAITGRAMSEPTSGPEETLAELDEVQQPATAHTPSTINQFGVKSTSQDSARAFLADIRRILRRFKDRLPISDEGSGADSADDKSRKNLRRDAQAAIRSCLGRSDSTLSTAIHALGMWVLYLLARPYRKSQLDAATVMRYLNALASGFRSFGYDIDLPDLDSDELTELYALVIDPTRDSATFSSSETRNARRRVHQDYVAKRVWDFHQFAREQYGLDEPDWEALGGSASALGGRPGHINEAEYLHALDLLCHAPNPASDRQLQEAFILLLCYRFGLRGSEAASLRYSDWINVSNCRLVTVTPALRKLKSAAARRQVPLLWRLSDAEEEIIEQWLSRWRAETGNQDESLPLFFEVGDVRQPVHIRNMRARLAEALRSATCNRGTTLHHARHAFANDVAIALLPEASQLIWRPAVDPSQWSHIRKTLLSTDRATRRSVWALACALGHASPRTTYCSYLHILPDWTAEHIRQTQPQLFTKVKVKNLQNAVNLDEWQVAANYLKTERTPNHRQEKSASPSSILKYARLRAGGSGASNAGADLGWSMMETRRVEDTFAKVGARLARAANPGKSVDDACDRSTLLATKIRLERFEVLIRLLENSERRMPPQPVDVGMPIDWQVGPSRQILLWKKPHFHQLHLLLSWTGLDAGAVRLFQSTKSLPEFQEWAGDYHLGRIRKFADEKTERPFRADVPTVLDESGIAMDVRHRVAAVAEHRNGGGIADSYELILLWMAFVLVPGKTHGG